MGLAIKDSAAIEKMRTAGRLTAQVLEMIEPFVVPGVSTEKLNQICEAYMIEELGAQPAPPTKGFPKAICTSVNQQVCHGIPNEKPLKEGDIVNIDISLSKDGYFGDSDKMFCVGECKPAARRLIQETQECLYRAIAYVKPGRLLKDIGKVIEEHAHAHYLSVVQEYCGHGIGTQLHEYPQVLHYYDKNAADILLMPGMTFTIEPMINMGRRHVKLMPDGWTVVTQDKSLSAQFEHTLLVTETGVEVLTLRQEERATLLPRLSE